MSDLRNGFIRFFTSLQLTVVLLALSIVLVFVATLDQVNLGIWAVQEKYFRSFFVLWTLPGTQIPLPVFPGGYVIGGLLMANLLASHVYRFRFSFKKCGIFLTHAGLILLLIGEAVSGLLQEDFQMELDLNKPTNYSESFLHHELVFTDTTDKDSDTVTAIPAERLRAGASLQHHTLPFSVRVLEFHPNAVVEMRQADDKSPAVASNGAGPHVRLIPVAMTYKSEERNMPAALLELRGSDGSLGTWLCSPWLNQPQSFGFAGRTYTVALRIERRYKPFTLTLTELRHDIYPGSDIPRNFSSRVRLQSQDGKEDREVLIFMNNPLRHAGYTFYQYQMNRAENHSVLQVVRNPGWPIPYVSCLMMSAGLTLHFGILLLAFLRRRFAPDSAAPASNANA